MRATLAVPGPWQGELADERVSRGRGPVVQLLRDLLEEAFAEVEEQPIRVRQDAKARDFAAVRQHRTRFQSVDRTEPCEPDRRLAPGGQEQRGVLPAASLEHAARFVDEPVLLAKGDVLARDDAQLLGEPAAESPQIEVGFDGRHLRPPHILSHVDFQGGSDARDGLEEHEPRAAREDAAPLDGGERHRLDGRVRQDPANPATLACG